MSLSSAMNTTTQNANTLENQFVNEVLLPTRRRKGKAFCSSSVYYMYTVFENYPKLSHLNLSPLFIELKSGIKKMTFHLVNETFSSDFQPLCSMLMAYYLWPLAMQMISLGSGASFVHEE